MLKIIACLTMLVDHMGYVFFPGQLWLRMIGRIAFPLFAWYVAVGFERTSNRGRYLLRLTGWGVLSQIPYVMLFHGGTLVNPLSLLHGTNVLFTFALALAGLWMLEATRKRSLPLRICAWLALPVLAVVAQLIQTDYGAYGVVMVLLFHFFRERRSEASEEASQAQPGSETAGEAVHAQRGSASTGEVRQERRRQEKTGGWPRLARILGLPAAILLWTFLCLAPMRMHPIQLLCVAAVPLLWMRLPDPRPGRWKYAFYAFYPVHLTILLLLVRL